VLARNRSRSLVALLAVVEALLFSVDGYEGASERTTYGQEAIWGAVFGAMGGWWRCECVVDCILGEGDVLYHRLQAAQLSKNFLRRWFFSGFLS